MPLVTRLYSPEDFALLAVYLAIVSTVAVAACFRLELAIPLANDDGDAANLLALATTALAIVTGVSLLLVLLLPETIAGWFGRPEMAPHLILVPLGIMFAGAYSAFQLWTTRQKRFATIARTRVAQAVVGVSAMVSLGWAGVTPFGLLLGNVLNIGAGGFKLGLQALRVDKVKLREVSRSRMRDVLHRYRRYPLYSTPEALLNIGGVQIPILLIAVHTKTEAGFLFLAMQVMSAPLTLLGASISQVYMSRASDALRDGQLTPFTLSILRRLLLVGLGPLVLVGALAPSLFPLVFGTGWARAGDIVTWMVPWMLLQFIASPVSAVMLVTGRQVKFLALTLIGAILRIGGVLLGIAGAGINPVGGLVLGSTLYYLLLILFVLEAINSRTPSNTRAP